jgi:hypothetical protein
MPLTVNEDDDSLPDERAAQVARDKGEPLQTMTLDADEGGESAAAAPAAAPAPADAPAPAAADAKPPEGDKPPEGEPKPDAAAQPDAKPPEGAADGEGDTTDQAPVQYQTPDARDWAKERKTLRDQKADIDKRWSDGDLSDEDRAAQIGALDDKLDDLTAEKTRTETLAEINRQNALNAEKEILARVSTEGSKVGIDYKLEANYKPFDALLNAVAIDPNNAKMTYAEMTQRAHELLCMSRGIKAPAATPAPPAPAAAPTPAAPAPRPNIPPTLHSMPNASVPPVQDEALNALDAADPDQAEALLASMNPAQKNALFYATMPKTGRRAH